MTNGFDPPRLDVPNESLTEPPDNTPDVQSDSAETTSRQVSTVRRKRRRRTFVPASTEFSTTHASPVYVPPEPGTASGTRRRRSRRRSNRRNYMKALRVVMYIAIHVVFIMLLVFLWMKISAKISE